MVVKMIRWPSWLPLSKKMEVKVVIQRLQGLNSAQVEVHDGRGENGDVCKKRRLVVEIKWKGQKGIGLGSLRRRRSVKRNFTEEGGFCGDGVFEWNEEFKNVCCVSLSKDGSLYPWEIAFSVFNCFNKEPRNVVLLGAAVLNLAEFSSACMEKEIQIEIPVAIPRGTSEGNSPSLHLSITLLELRTVLEPPQVLPSPMEPVPQAPSPALVLSPQKDELFGFRAGLRKMTMFRGTKKAHNEEDSDFFDTDVEGESEENARSRLTFNYESLAYANGSFFLNALSDGEDEGWIYYNNQQLDLGSTEPESLTKSVIEQYMKQSFRQRILPWSGRKLSFRSSKPQTKGEPLLKKDYGEEGGDDIDFDRRQLSSSGESSFGWNKSDQGSTPSRSSLSDFGDDSFAVGSWELKEIVSRDGHMKLQAQVFFASIDQRSERAAGESACTALVAVIANWLQSNQHEMPIKSEFDSLIRDGSLEWRKLCDNDDYREHFPDKHFDLETVLQAKVRPIAVVPEKSFIGFFHPEGLEGEDFDFLHGAMSFDSIWEEIDKCTSSVDPLFYIVSWNDHFFLLKVEHDAYYIIDTLGERLYEGCNQAYVLKFDKDTTIKHQREATQPADAKTASDKVQPQSSREPSSTDEDGTEAEGTLQLSSNDAAKTCDGSEEEIVCKGKESCKEYMKNFLAAIPIRELQADIKKGLMASTLLHQRLQIEFHCTRLMQCADIYSSSEVAMTVAGAPTLEFACITE